MAPTLFMVPYSQPVRAVLMLIKALDLEVNLEEVNLFEKQQLSPEYLKKNPQHSVPTLLEEDGFVLWDSHAIMPYLIENYSKDDSLYPKDSRKRAVINQRLHFDSGVLFPRSMAILRPLLYDGVKTVSQEKTDAVLEGYDLLERFLDGHDFVAGDSVSIADFSVLASVSSSTLVVPLNPKEHSNISAWMSRMQEFPFYEPERTGLEMMSKSVRAAQGAAS